MDQEKVRNRMMKLLALARRGERGEKETAEYMLTKMLDKHGMSLADLDDAAEEKREVKLTYKGALEKDLLVSVLCMVLGSRTISVRRYKGGKSLMVDLTRAQELEVELHWEIYRRELAKTMRHTLLAFIHRNNIVSGESREDGEEADSDLSPEDVAAIMGIMSGMRPTQVRKAITA